METSQHAFPFTDTVVQETETPCLHQALPLTRRWDTSFCEMLPQIPPAATRGQQQSSFWSGGGDAELGWLCLVALVYWPQNSADLDGRSILLKVLLMATDVEMEEQEEHTY